MTDKNYKISSSAANPFADSQARNYSDELVIKEFCPVSNYWSLFNDQHEILIGTRGCGKTVLLKMMRYSMLNKLTDPKAQRIISEKKYVAFYVPLHLEYIKKLSKSNYTIDKKITWFRFAFNCALAQSVIIELAEILKDCHKDEMDRIRAEFDLVKSIDQSWMIENQSPVFQLSKLREKVTRLFYNTDPLKSDIIEMPNVFTHSFGSALSSISSIICEKLCISPTWIVCVDEAEFLDECYQKCINTAFRSDTDNIAYKVATLHFYHTTKSTLDNRIDVMNGQDFKYTTVDMKYDDTDFIHVTDSLVKTRFWVENIHLDKLEDFVETLGNDNYIDYYSNQFGKDKVQRDRLEREMLDQLSENSKRHNSMKSTVQIRKSVFDKLAPIFYLREVFQSKKGRYIPGWYAGATMIRRVAQGNPRIFIRIMNELYNEAKGKALPLTLKKQAKIMLSFSKSFCEETQTLEQVGPEAQTHLETISQVIHDNTHGPLLVQSGTSFRFKRNTDLDKHKLWIEKSVAFSRLVVDDNSLKTEISINSVFQLANVYAVKYWLPMRSNTSPVQIELEDNITSSYTIIKPKKRKEAKRNPTTDRVQLTLNDLGDYNEE